MPTLDHVVIAVSDWERSNAFYRDVVGAELVDTGHGTREQVQDHLAAHGVAVEEGPVTRFGARGEGSSVYFRDPDGTLLEFIVY